MVLSLTLSKEWGNWGTERLTIFCKSTYLVRGKARTWRGTLPLDNAFLTTGLASFSSHLWPPYRCPRSTQPTAAQCLRSGSPTKADTETRILEKVFYLEEEFRKPYKQEDDWDEEERKASMVH